MNGSPVERAGCTGGRCVDPGHIRTEIEAISVARGGVILVPPADLHGRFGEASMTCRGNRSESRCARSFGSLSPLQEARETFFKSRGNARHWLTRLISHPYRVKEGIIGCGLLLNRIVEAHPLHGCPEHPGSETRCHPRRLWVFVDITPMNKVTSRSIQFLNLIHGWYAHCGAWFEQGRGVARECCRYSIAALFAHQRFDGRAPQTDPHRCMVRQAGLGDKPDCNAKASV